jgi:peptidoglycan hydrolase CwlO-like protein
MTDGKPVYDIRRKNAPMEPERFPQRIELHVKRFVSVPLKKAATYAICSVAIISFLFGLAQAPIDRTGSLYAASSNDAERAGLEAQLAQLEKEIADNEATIAQYQKQGKTLQSEINTLNAKIAKLNAQIRAITLTLQKLNSQIGETKTKITETETSIGEYKESISSILQTLYEQDGQGMLQMVMENPRFSDFFLDINSLLALQDSLRQTLEKVIVLKNDLMNQKESLALQYEDAEQLRVYQQQQQQSAKLTEGEKKTLLAETKGQESKYQAIVADKKKTAAQIRSRLYELLGGGELTFGEAYRFAKIAGDATGVRPALILAVLDRESALGRNVGKCKYDVNPYYPAQASNKTTMHPTRDIPHFLAITKELNLDPSNVFVSCPIPRDGAYGGAMGPAQFIPSTWVGYKKSIAAITGNNPPSPWNNMDAFVATALYMKSAGAVNGDLYSEKVAAAKYYAGGNWRNYLNTYGARVVARAQEFQEDIDVLNS